MPPPGGTPRSVVNAMGPDLEPLKTDKSALRAATHTLFAVVDPGLVVHPHLSTQQVTCPPSCPPGPHGSDPEALPADRCPVSHFVGLTVTANDAFAVFALVSVDEQVTRVLPILKRLPDLGEHATGNVPSRSSCAVTRKATRADFAPFLVLTSLLTAPVRVGRMRSKSRPDTLSVPVHVWRPKRDPPTDDGPRACSSVPLPDAPA